MKKLISILSISCLVVLSGCAGFAPMVSSSHKHSSNDAYLYGRFYIDAEDQTLALSGHMNMGFSIVCDNNESYLVGFSRENPIRVVRISPATCTLKEIVYTNSDGFVRSRKPAPDSSFMNMKIEGNTAYYLGDYFAKASHSVGGSTIYYNWDIYDIKNDFAKTTADMKETYPNLNAVQSIDRMIVTKR